MFILFTKSRMKSVSWLISVILKANLSDLTGRKTTRFVFYLSWPWADFSSLELALVLVSTEAPACMASMSTPSSKSNPVPTQAPTVRSAASGQLAGLCLHKTKLKVTRTVQSVDSKHEADVLLSSPFPQTTRFQETGISQTPNCT